MHNYIWGIIKAKNCILYRINGMPDHLHFLSDLHPSVCLSDYVKDIKLASGLWIKEKGCFPRFSGWQDGYGAFTYTINDKAKIISYIKNQKEHHKSESSLDEYKCLLIENGIDFDENIYYKKAKIFNPFWGCCTSLQSNHGLYPWLFLFNPFRVFQDFG